MKTKTINLYTFDELSKDVQDKVLQNFRDEDECEYLPDDMQYKIDELLKENNITGKARVYYSLSNCQGDGAMFEGEFQYKDITLYIEHSGMYYHFNSKTIEAQETNNLGYHIDEEEPLNKQVEEFEALYETIARELEKYGYDCIEAHNSDENLIEMINANDYLFTDKGIIDSI